MHQLMTWIMGYVKTIVGGAVVAVFTTLLKRRLLFWWRQLRIWVNQGPFWHDVGKRLREFRQRRASTTFSRRMALFAAGTLLLGVVSGRLTSIYSWQEYELGYGEPTTITLRDGSRIVLSAQTRLWVRETSRARSISLQQGEALFTVAADRSRPFTVSVGTVAVRALGTEFSIRRQAEGVVDALVSSGSVEILTHAAEGASQTGSSGVPVVAAGQAVHIMPGGGASIATIGSSDVGRRLAWTAGRFEFNESTVTEAVAEFNRYNRRQLVIADPAIATRHVSGSFKVTSPDLLAQSLEMMWGIPYSLSGSAEAGNEVIRLGVAK